MKIKNIILNILASILIITLFLFAFTWIIFDFQGSSNSLKDTWSIVSSLFGGITTLAAAYIASLFYNNWKHQEKLKKTIELYDAGIKSLRQSLENIHNLKKLYSPFHLDLDIGKRNIFQKIFDNLIKKRKDLDPEKTKSLQRLDLIENSFKNCLELALMYQNDYQNCMKTEVKLQKFFEANMDFYILLKFMIINPDNCAHLIQLDLIENVLVTKLEELEDTSNSSLQ